MHATLPVRDETVAFVTDLLDQERTVVVPARRYRTPLAVATRDHAPSGRLVPADPSDQRASLFMFGGYN